MKFPDQYWDQKKRAELAKITFLAHPDWEKRCDPGPYDDATTGNELKELMRKQGDPERKVRAAQIVNEATEITEDFAHLLLYREDSHVNTRRVFWQAITVGRTVVMHFKNKYSRPRPAQLEPQLRPLVTAPGHPAYPSGHSTQMHLVALSLSEITAKSTVPTMRDQLLEIAGRVAENREWGGVHYASDSAAGIRLAQNMYPLFRESSGADFDAAIQEWT